MKKTNFHLTIRPDESIEQVAEEVQGIANKINISRQSNLQVTVSEGELNVDDLKLKNQETWNEAKEDLKLVLFFSRFKAVKTGEIEK